MKFLFALLFLTLTTASTAFAEDCSEIRLDQSVLKHVSLANQGSSNLCYAYAAAQLVDAYRASQGVLTSPISPLLLAAQTIRATDDERNSIYGGWVQTALETAQKEGLCTGSPLTPPDALLQELEMLYKKSRAGEDKSAIAAKVRDVLLQQGAQFVPSQDDIQGFLSLGLSKFVGHALASTCKGSVDIPLPSSQSLFRRDSGSQGLASEVHSQLEQNHPVAVNFCADVVTRRSFSPRYGDNSCSRHYAVIVGRANIEGQCHFLVRDSQCDKYKTKDGSPICKDSQYWILNYQLMNNTDGITWLDTNSAP